MKYMKEEKDIGWKRNKKKRKLRAHDSKLGGGAVVVVVLIRVGWRP